MRLLKKDGICIMKTPGESSLLRSSKCVQLRNNTNPNHSYRFHAILNMKSPLFGGLNPNSLELKSIKSPENLIELLFFWRSRVQRLKARWPVGDLVAVTATWPLSQISLPGRTIPQLDLELGPFRCHGCLWTMRSYSSKVIWWKLSCMYVCMYIYIYIHTHTHIYIYLHLCIYIYIDVDIYWYIHIYIYINVIIYIYVYIYICIYIHMYVYICINACMYVNMYVCIYIYVPGPATPLFLFLTSP